MTRRTLITGDVIRTTDAAVLVDIDDERKWIPRSVCANGEDLDVGDSDLEVENWWLRKEGLK